MPEPGRVRCGPVHIPDQQFVSQPVEEPVQLSQRGSQTFLMIHMVHDIVTRDTTAGILAMVATTLGITHGIAARAQML